MLGAVVIAFYQVMIKQLFKEGWQGKEALLSTIIGTIGAISIGLRIDVRDADQRRGVVLRPYSHRLAQCWNHVFQ